MAQRSSATARNAGGCFVLNAYSLVWRPRFAEFGFEVLRIHTMAPSPDHRFQTKLGSLTASIADRPISNIKTLSGRQSDQCFRAQHQEPGKIFLARSLKSFHSLEHFAPEQAELRAA